MQSHVISFQDLGRDAIAATQAADEGPVLILDGTTPKYVVLSFDDYEHLRTPGPSLAEVLGMPSTSEEIDDFKVAQLSDFGFRSVDFA